MELSSARRRCCVETQINRALGVPGRSWAAIGPHCSQCRSPCSPLGSAIATRDALAAHLIPNEAHVFKLHVSQDRPLILHLEQLLKQNGIECTVRGAALGGAVGELPWHETWPELWLIHEKDLGTAQRIVQPFLTEAPTDLARWTCRQCAESVGGQFSMCWNCGAEAVSGSGERKG
ncbi:MAG: hypothetical protein ACJA1R_003265 [Flavobacteriales bacterium]